MKWRINLGTRSGKVRAMSRSSNNQANTMSRWSLRIQKYAGILAFGAVGCWYMFDKYLDGDMSNIQHLYDQYLGDTSNIQAAERKDLEMTSLVNDSPKEISTELKHQVANQTMTSNDDPDSNIVVRALTSAVYTSWEWLVYCKENPQIGALVVAGFYVGLYALGWGGLFDEFGRNQAANQAAGDCDIQAPASLPLNDDNQNQNIALSDNVASNSSSNNKIQDLADAIPSFNEASANVAADESHSRQSPIDNDQSRALADVKSESLLGNGIDRSNAFYDSQVSLNNDSSTNVASLQHAAQNDPLLRNEGHADVIVAQPMPQSIADMMQEVVNTSSSNQPQPTPTTDVKSEFNALGNEVQNLEHQKQCHDLIWD